MKRILALMLCTVFLFSGCTGDGGAYVPTGDGLSYDEEYIGPENTEPSEEEPQILTIAYYRDETLNPFLCTDFTNRALFSLLYQSLFTVDRDYVVEPQLCKNFTVSEDMKQYTFYLEKATFPSGAVLTAEDVVASLTAAWESDFYKGRFLHVLTIAPTADGGVVITLDTPYENLPLILDIPIVPASQVESDRPAGTGPYAIYSAPGGESLRRKTDWWCSPPMAVTAETITLLPAESTTHIRDQFEFADLSLVCADPGSDRYADYRCDYELWDCENGIFLYLGVSGNSKVFQNPEVCTALTYAVDRDMLVKDYYRGFARSACLPASPLSPYYNHGLAERYAYDGVRFAQAVKNAGVQEETVVFLVNKDDSLRLRVARAIGQMLEDCGLKVELKALGSNAYVEALKAWNYDLYLGQTRLSPNMDLSAFFATYGNLSWGGVNDVSAYSFCLQALENHGNYYTLHKTVMDNGLLCPVLFRSYAVYAIRGLLTELEPTRDGVFYYSLGKNLEDCKRIIKNAPTNAETE